MDFFELEYDVNKYEDTGIVAYNSKLYDINMYDVARGRIIENWDERVTFNLTLDDMSVLTDYLWNDLGWLIVSKKFKNAMEEQNILGIQYLKLNIRNDIDNSKIEGYYVANVYNLIEAMDMQQSEYFELRPGRYSFVSFVVKEDRVRGFDIFRLKEFDTPIFVSEKFKKMIERNKLTGFHFAKVKAV